MNNPVMTTGAAALTVTQIEALVIYVAGLFHLPPLPENVAAAIAVLAMVLAHAVYVRFQAKPIDIAPVGAVSAALLIAVMAPSGLSACSTTGTSTAWTPQQTAYIELKVATAAEVTAHNVIIGVPGLSQADIADIAAGGAALSQATQAAVASLTAGGTVGQQATSAAVSAVASAASNLGSVLNAKHGASVDPNVALLVAGESALQSLPPVIAAVVQVNGGYQPSTTDINNATADLQGAAAALTRTGV